MLRVVGVVQGVGFRPHVHGLATRLGLTGTVQNRTGDVWIEVEGDPAALEHFATELERGPPLARIDRLERSTASVRGDTELTILPSLADPSQAGEISADIATCRVLARARRRRPRPAHRACAADRPGAAHQACAGLAGHRGGAHRGLAEELVIARRVQTSIVPHELAVPGLDLAARMIPADQVGGDYYDVVPFPGGCWLAIGDVSGHSLNSGLIMLMLQSALSGVLAARPDAAPSELLGFVNQVLHDNIRNRLGQSHHVTFSLVRYTDDGRLVVTGAHEDIIVVRQDGRVETVSPPGTWLDVERDIGPALRDHTLELGEGDTLVLYTDGITEAQGAARCSTSSGWCGASSGYEGVPRRRCATMCSARSGRGYRCSAMT